MKTSAAAAVAAACAPKKSAEKAPESPEAMIYRENPNNGDRVSLLGFGCMRWPMIKGPDGNDIIDQEAVNEMVDYAMEHGVNYFDTSPAYLQGLSEDAAGKALSRHPRESYYIATKLSNFGNVSAEASEKEAGRIRNLGFSFHGSQNEFDYFMELEDSGQMHWDFCQIEMNYIDWRHADGVRNANAEYLYAELDKRGIPIVIMEPLLGGRLANVPEGISRQLKEREPEKSIASWAFRFCGTFPRVLCILSGMTSMDPLLDNINTFGHFKPLTEEELSFMERMAVQMKEYPLVNCTDCKYCMPCPWGIDIPGVFQHYNRSVTEGTFAQSRDQKDYAKLKKAYLRSYDKAVATVRQADRCIHCKECLPRCPQSISIPRELERIARYVESLKQDTL